MNCRILLLAVSFVLTVCSGSLQAQEPRNAVSIDLFLPAMSPVSHLSGEDSAFVPLNVKYQRVLTDHGVMMMTMGLTYSWDSGGERTLDIHPMLALDWHPFSTGLKGFYLGPSMFFTYSDYAYSGTISEDNLDHSYWAGMGGNIGYEFLLRSGVVIDLIFGLGYGYLKEVDAKGRTSASRFQFDETTGGVYVGCAF